jgi:hypothetical protein
VLSEKKILNETKNIPPLQVKLSVPKFLWNGKRDNVKSEILTQSYEDGGLKMTDNKLCCQALKIAWKKKYIDPLNFSPWKLLLNGIGKNDYLDKD